MGKETIEQKTYRLMMHVYGESLLSEERAVQSKNFRYFCQLLELEIAEEREASGWRDIESAPKDETPIDLWRRTATWPSGERLPNMRRVYDGNGGVFYDPVFAGPCVVRDASHWMPIPSAPKDEVSE